MNDRRHFVRREADRRQISRYLIAGLSFIILVTMLTLNLLNVAQAGARAEKAALIEMPPHQSSALTRRDIERR